MNYQKILFSINLSVLMILILAGCGNAQPTPTPDIVVEITGDEYRAETTDTVAQPNCDGTAEVEYQFEKSWAIAHTIEVQGGVEVNANGQIGFAGTDVELGATVAGQLGHSYGTVENVSRSVTVKAGPGTNMKHYIKQQEVWKIGTAKIVVNNQELTVPFNFRHDFKVELVNSENIENCDTLVASPSEVTPNPTVDTQDTSTTDTTCFPQTGWTPPKLMENGEWIYDCLSSGEGNWVGQEEAWKAANWERGTGQSEIVNIVVPIGATKLGLGCDPCTVLKPDGTSVSSINGNFGPFRPNISVDARPGEIYKVKIFGGDTCSSRPQAIPPCPPEIFIWFNLSSLTESTASSQNLCPFTIKQSEVNSWKVGIADVPTVQSYVNDFDSRRPSNGGAFEIGSKIPVGVLVATNFDEKDANRWSQYPVIAIVHSGSWGLFQTTGEYTAPNAGACLSINP